MLQKKMTLKEILKALDEKVANSSFGEEAAEIEELKVQPKFQRLIDALLEEGKRSDEQRSRVILEQPAAPGEQSGTEQRGESRVTVVGCDKPPVPLPGSSVLSIFYHPNHERHFSPQYPMESPQRVKSIITALQRQGLLDSPNCTLSQATPATPEDIRRIHDTSYVDFIHSYSSRGGGSLPRNTYLSQGSWQAALGAAGCALAAGEAVRKGSDFAFALTRPPGHHAGHDSYGGFCLFNNAAILARSLGDNTRVMILNWDAHASDGTKRIFYSDPGVLTLSLHRDPTDFFPREGWPHEIGAEAGEGYSVNVPLPVGSGDMEYLEVFDLIVVPLHRQFNPNYLIVECGFDAHHKDPLGGQKMTNNGYCELGKRLALMHRSGIVFTLEGGYNPDTIGEIACSLIFGLSGKPNPFVEKLYEGKMGKEDRLSYSLMPPSGKGSREPTGRGKQIKYVMEQVRHNLGKYWNLK